MHPPVPEPGDSSSNSASNTNSAEFSHEGFESHSSSDASSALNNGICRDQFSVNLTAQFLLISFLIATSIAFSIGMISRTILLSSIEAHPLTHPNENEIISVDNRLHFPRIVPFNNEIKDVPLTSFTTKLFPQQASTTSHTVHLDRRYLPDGRTDREDNDTWPTTWLKDNSIRSSKQEDNEEFNKDEQEYHDKIEDENDTNENTIHLPSGHHLFIDIKHVDSQFLNSQERIAQAIVDLVKTAEVSLLSYHCHSLNPIGVSCVGIILSSHVSVHTWPSEGVIVIDLFTCNNKPLVQAIPVVEKLFAIPSSEEDGSNKSFEPRLLWSHKLRGFRQGFSGYNPYENPYEQDLSNDLLRRHTFDLKLPLLSDETDFQHVDIYEVINPQMSSLASYEKSLSNDGSYESLHPDLYKPDKILFLDGVQQSTLYGEAAYHEALVHPSMIAHPNPTRVAIIGGGEGATLREVLKHKSVEEVRMVEIDGELVEMCEEYLPEMSNCTDMIGSDAESCFDDSRANVVMEDAFKYFMDTFGEGKEHNESEKFDVIIMDALDPDKFVAIVGSLYKDNHFVSSLFHGLTEEGVFVVQLGEANQLSDPANEVGPFKDTANMMDALEHVGFQSMHIYDEGHSHFYAAWSYLLCFRDSKSRQSWYKSTAQLEIELYHRLYRTKSGKPALLSFDAPTMASYQVPSKVYETTDCRKVDAPPECRYEYHGIDPESCDPVSKFEAGQSGSVEYAGQRPLGTVYSPVVERHLRETCTADQTRMN